MAKRCQKVSKGAKRCQKVSKAPKRYPKARLQSYILIEEVSQYIAIYCLNMSISIAIDITYNAGSSH